MDFSNLTETRSRTSYDFNASTIGGLWTLSIILLGLYVLSSQLSKRNRFKDCQSAQVTAPMKDPFFGLDFLYERLFCNILPAGHLEACYRRFLQLGTTYSASRWTIDIFETCDSANIKHILSTNFHDYKYPAVRSKVMSEFVGSGILTLDGPGWAKARALMKPAFTKKHLEGLEPMFESHFEKLLAKLHACGQEVDLQPLFFDITMDIATDFLFGRSAGMLHQSCENTIPGLDTFNEDSLISSVEAASKMRLGPLNILRHNSKANAAKKRVFIFVERYIQESLTELRGNDNSEKELPGKNHLLEELSDAFEEPGELRDHVLHLLLASRDTTASLLSSLFFVLAQKPDIYTRLREEVSKNIGDNIPTFQQLREMQYLKWCVNECKSASINIEKLNPD